MLREFSISQFTYLDREQYKAIEREVGRNKRKYGQSYEGYFINEDGTLNYQEMILTIDRIIASGAHSVNKALNKDRHRVRDLEFVHPESVVHQLVKEETYIKQEGINPEDISEIILSDDSNIDLFDLLY